MKKLLISEALFLAALGLTTLVRPAFADVQFTSPAKKFVVGFEAVDPTTARFTKAAKGDWEQYREQFWMKFYPAASSATLVTTLIYEEVDPPPSPAEIFKGMVWSPSEAYVAFPILTRATQGHHRFTVVVALNETERTNLRFEADHLHWLDDTHLIGDLNTKAVPGGLIELDQKARKSDIALDPLRGIGYHLVKTEGWVATVEEFANDYPSPDKTTWEVFTPACLTLDLKTLKKRSVSCPTRP